MSRRLVASTAVLAACAAVLAVPGLPAAGATPVSAAAVAASSVPGGFVPLTPARLLDTRKGLGAPKAVVAAGQTLTVASAGRGGVPATGVSAVVLTLTVTGSRAPGYLTAFPHGGTAPTASVLNWTAGETRAGSATVTVDADGRFDLRPSTGTQLIADVAGYVLAGSPTAAGAYVALPPARVLDTRTGIGGPATPVVALSPRTVRITGRGGVPATGVSAVVATVTATDATRGGDLRAYASDGAVPGASALNYRPGRAVANQVTVPVGADGSIALFASTGELGAVVDVTGYVLAGTPTAAGTYRALPPARLFDSRTDGGLSSGQEVTVAGGAGVPALGAAAVVANLTVVSTGPGGYLTAFPAGVAVPTASNLSWSAADTLANQATVPLGRAGAIGLFANDSTAGRVVVDVSGYYLAPPPAPATNLTATVTGSGVRLTWTASTDPVAGYTVRRTTGSTPPASLTDGTLVAEVGPDTTTATDDALAPNTAYRYAVFAHDGVPNAGAPATAAVAADGTAPGPVTGLTANPGVTSVALSWTPPTDPDLAAIVVRYAAGGTPPAGPTDGTGTAAVPGRLGIVVTGLDGGRTSSFSVFTRDVFGNVSTTPLSVTSTTLGVTGLTGTTIPLPPGALDPQKILTDDACPSAGHCVAVSGFYDETAARHGLLMLTVAGDTGPVSHVVPLPTTVAGFTRPVAAVSCTSDTDCTLVGSYTEDGSLATVAFSAHWNGTTATSAVLPASDGADAVRPADVSCPAAGQCVAVGSRQVGDAPYTPWIARLAGGVWTEVTPVTTGAAFVTSLTGVTCRSVTTCAAVGDVNPIDGSPAFVVATTDGVTWTAATPAPPSGTIGWTRFGRIACPAEGSCLIAGRARISAADRSTSAAVLTLANGAWTVTSLVGSTSTDSFETVDTACGGGRCVVLAGRTGARSTLFVPVGGVWVPKYQNALPSGAADTPGTGLQGLACDATGRCVATGDWADSHGFLRGWVSVVSDTGNSATSVTPSKPARLGGSGLRAPSCTADGSHCVAGDNYIADTENAYLATFGIVGG